ncbi:MAG: class I SAM-dependent methyltransferase [Nitrospiria bacterium]
MKITNSKEFIESQQRDWNRVAKGWEKWDALLEKNMSFVDLRLVSDARIRPGIRVLDLGSGTGYPALLAAKLVGESGRIIGQDLAGDMLQVARLKAKSLGLENIMFRTGDVTVLSFEDQSFDAVISRFCLMFLPEIPKAMKEIARVLKPGGYISAAVWASPEQNPYLQIPINAIKKFDDVPPIDSEQPGIFRLARAGDLLGMAKQAGLTGVSDDTLEAVSVFKDPDEYYERLMDMSAPIQTFISKFTSEQKTALEKEVKSKVAQYAVGNEIQIPMSIRIVVALKPH